MISQLYGSELHPGSGVRAGLLGWSAYTGAAAAGLPLGWLIQSSGWQAWVETGQHSGIGIPQEVQPKKVTFGGFHKWGFPQMGVPQKSPNWMVYRGKSH